MLLRTLLAWLRGEPRVCSMVRIPSETEEDMRRPERERERLVSERIALENRLENLLCLRGIAGFKPRLRKAAERLDSLRSFAGAPLPPMLLEELHRLMARHRVLSDQLREIEAAREQAAMAAEPDCAVQQIQMLARLVGLGLATATGLTREVFCRSFSDRRAIAGFVGLTGTPFNSRGSEREQGISKAGNPRVRRILLQLAVALAALPAGQRAQLLVRRAHRWRQRTHPQDHGGGARPQAAGGVVALRRDRRSAGRRPPRRRLRGERSNHAQTQIEKQADDDGYIKPDSQLGGRCAVPGYGCEMPRSRLGPHPRSPRPREWGIMVRNNQVPPDTSLQTDRSEPGDRPGW